MTKRHPEPLYLKEWLAIATKIPRCCHTCEHYSVTGICEEFDMTPPEEFAAKEMICTSWNLQNDF